ncbi:FadR/GntR family transcriptional regulator [Catenulispora pinisilvae]|uniref:FadR/GntR family transcriptional regulator n=1 Tax=Catenulispora pinisilvae TaxID=2705253 RepID=UPI001890DF4B|nr:FCD domain-containing protein [Catenulispora pinisilvae]
MADTDPPGAEPPASYRPGYEVAAERILEYIVREQLAPGSRLPTEKDLADALGLSRTVVREAVKVLSAVGRLSVQKGRGMFVAEPRDGLFQDAFAQFLPADLRQVDELLEFRHQVETTAAGLAAQRATPTQVKAIRQAAAMTAQAAQDGVLRDFITADNAFHDCVGKASANMFFSGAVNAIRRVQQQVATIGLADNPAGSLDVAAEQHTAIAEAIAGGEDRLAERLMAEHIDQTARQFQTAIQRRLVDDGAG